MIIMTHIGDPDTWYAGKYADAGKYGTRDEHYRMWESHRKDYGASISEFSIWTCCLRKESIARAV